MLPSKEVMVAPFRPDNILNGQIMVDQTKGGGTGQPSPPGGKACHNAGLGPKPCGREEAERAVFGKPAQMGAVHGACIDILKSPLEKERAKYLIAGHIGYRDDADTVRRQPGRKIGQHLLGRAQMFQHIERKDQIERPQIWQGGFQIVDHGLRCAGADDGGERGMTIHPQHLGMGPAIPQPRQRRPAAAPNFQHALGLIRQ